MTEKQSQKSRICPGQIDVVIPVYKPDRIFGQVLAALQKQTVRPSHILLVNTEKELFDEHCMDGIEQVKVIHIKKTEFDHGGTRHMAASLLNGEFLLFLTQDAVPADTQLIEALLQSFQDPKVCAAYARQLPKADCDLLERYTRSFNYGEESRIKTAENLSELGIKTFFCSNVCAMYRRTAYEELGGFEPHTIFNEDMIFAGKLIQKQKAVAYCAEAKVLHSHNYTGIQQFRRNFDLGVSQAEHPELFGAVRSENEGIKMVKKTAEYLLKIRKPQLLLKLVYVSGCKYIGYRLGKSFKSLPKWMIRRCTMNQEYWQTKAENNISEGSSASSEQQVI